MGCYSSSSVACAPTSTAPHKLRVVAKYGAAVSLEVETSHSQSANTGEWSPQSCNILPELRVAEVRAETHVATSVDSMPVRKRDIVLSSEFRDPSLRQLAQKISRYAAAGFHEHGLVVLDPNELGGDNCGGPRCQSCCPETACSSDIDLFSEGSSCWCHGQRRRLEDAAVHGGYVVKPLAFGPNGHLKHVANMCALVEHQEDATEQLDYILDQPPLFNQQKVEDLLAVASGSKASNSYISALKNGLGDEDRTAAALGLQSLLADEDSGAFAATALRTECFLPVLVQMMHRENLYSVSCAMALLHSLVSALVGDVANCYTELCQIVSAPGLVDGLTEALTHGDTYGRYLAAMTLFNLVTSKACTAKLRDCAQQSLQVAAHEDCESLVREWAMRSFLDIESHSMGGAIL